MKSAGRRMIAGFAACAAIACQGGGSVDFRVLAAEGDTPYRGADRVLVAVERDGQLDPETASVFEVNAERWPVRDIAYGLDLRLRVEARAGSLVLARGRSLPFDMESAEQVPSADVWLGTLGRFGAVLEGIEARAIAPSVGGAFGVDAEGRRFEVAAHDPASGRMTLARTGADVSGLAWVVTAGALVGVAESRWVQLDSDGSRQEEALETGHEEGTALAGWPGGVLLVAPSGGLISLLGAPGSGERQDLVPLAGPFETVRAVSVPVGDTTRVVVLADGMLFVVDPTGGLAPARVEGADGMASGATLTPLAPGLVAVIGGVDSGVPVADIVLLVLGGERPQRLRPPPLFEARVDPAVVRLREGLVLIVGGIGQDGPLATAELLQVGLSDLPGDVSVTGSLPWAMSDPRGTRLRDGAVLISGAEGCALYFDPRDPAP